MKQYEEIINRYQQAIIKHLQKNKSAGRNELAKAAGLSKRRAQWLLGMMEDAGKLWYVFGGSVPGQYELAGKVVKV